VDNKFAHKNASLSNYGSFCLFLSLSYHQIEKNAMENGGFPKKKQAGASSRPMLDVCNVSNRVCPMVLAYRRTFRLELPAALPTLLEVTLYLLRFYVSITYQKKRADFSLV
jgi:hypothetical protein